MRRSIEPRDVPVWIASGRWGPKRIRVSQCPVVLRAEAVYTGLLRDNHQQARPGAEGSLSCTFEGQSEPLTADWELRANAVWRFGRLFLRCPACARRATRLYVPKLGVGFGLRCRRCWGLTYESRQERSYKASGGRRNPPSMSHRELSRWYTDGARKQRAAASEARWAERRAILRRAK
jgi:hypothetical protein